MTMFWSTFHIFYQKTEKSRKSENPQLVFNMHINSYCLFRFNSKIGKKLDLAKQTFPEMLVSADMSVMGQKQG